MDPSRVYVPSSASADDLKLAMEPCTDFLRTAPFVVDIVPTAGMPTAGVLTAGKASDECLRGVIMQYRAACCVPPLYASDEWWLVTVAQQLGPCGVRFLGPDGVIVPVDMTRKTILGATHISGALCVAPLVFVDHDARAGLERSIAVWQTSRGMVAPMCFPLCIRHCAALGDAHASQALPTILLGVGGVAPSPLLAGSRSEGMGWAFASAFECRLSASEKYKEDTTHPMPVALGAPVMLWPSTTAPEGRAQWAPMACDGTDLVMWKGLVHRFRKGTTKKPSGTSSQKVYLPGVTMTVTTLHVLRTYSPVVWLSLVGKPPFSDCCCISLFHLDVTLAWAGQVCEAVDVAACGEHVAWSFYVCHVAPDPASKLTLREVRELWSANAEGYRRYPSLESANKARDKLTALGCIAATVPWPSAEAPGAPATATQARAVAVPHEQGLPVADAQRETLVCMGNYELERSTITGADLPGFLRPAPALGAVPYHTLTGLVFDSAASAEAASVRLTRAGVDCIVCPMPDVLPPWVIPEEELAASGATRGQCGGDCSSCCKSTDAPRTRQACIGDLSGLWLIEVSPMVGLRDTALEGCLGKLWTCTLSSLVFDTEHAALTAQRLLQSSGFGTNRVHKYEASLRRRTLAPREFVFVPMARSTVPPHMLAQAPLAL